MPQLSDWLRGPAAARLLGVNSTKPLRKLARRGMVGVRQIPGGRPLYYKPDVERLSLESVRPALTFVRGNATHAVTC